MYAIPDGTYKHGQNVFKPKNWNKTLDDETKLPAVIFMIFFLCNSDLTLTETARDFLYSHKNSY